MNNDFKEIRLFNRFYRRIINVTDSALSTNRYSVKEALVLKEICFAGNCFASEIALATGLDKAQLSRLLGRLKAIGLVEMEPYENDRRCLSIHLTADGRQETAMIMKKWDAKMQQLLAAMTRAKQKELIVHMKRIRELFDDTI